MGVLLLSFSLFLTAEALFHIDDTDQLLSLSDQLSFLPSLFGYSQEKGELIFPNKTYPRCASVSPKTSNWVKLHYHNNTLEMLCKRSNFLGMFVTGPIDGIRLSNPTDLRPRWKVREYTGTPMSIPADHDFAIATCKPDSRVFELYFHQPRNNPQIHKRLDSYKGNSRSKPMIILMPVVDSFSRRHFYRKLPLTVDYLNLLNGNESEWSVFDFKLHNIIGADTAENMNRIFGEKWVKRFDGNQNTDFHGETAIWTILKSKGFVTLFGSDACNHNMPMSIGRKPKVDYAVNLFYCALYAYGDYRAAKQFVNHQRCVGPHMSHYYLMNYTLEFSEMYRGRNQWIFAHFTAAHEQTGQHAATLDEDLRDYVRNYTEKFGKDHEIVVLMHGDHGMRYGEFLTHQESIQEHRLPAFFLIARKAFLNDYSPAAISTLTHNTYRLNTKPDIRETTLALANWQSNSPSPPSKSRFFNLLSDRIPDNRDCDMADIPIWYCSQYLPTAVSRHVFTPRELNYTTRSKDEQELGRLIHLLAVEVVYTMNSDVYSPYFMVPGWLCRKLSLKEIRAAGFTEISKGRYLVKIMFAVEESDRAEFDSWLLLTPEPYNDEVMKHENYRSQPFVYQGKRLYYRLIIALRTDKYGGECELYSRRLGLNPQYCICESFTETNSFYLDKIKLAVDS